MKDSEIGDLWKFYTNDPNEDGGKYIILLIMALIEARSAQTTVFLGSDAAGDEPERAACHDFGIPYEEYLKARGET